MAKKHKGRYLGPDAFKGDKDTLAAWRKAGRPKNIQEFLKTQSGGGGETKPPFKGKYPGPDEFQGDENAIAGWKASGKDDLYTQAWGLSKSKYAPVLKELEMNEQTNTSLYTNAANQRKAALDREIGSINAAGATGRTRIGETGAANQSMYQQAMAQSQTQTKDLLSAVGKNNSDMLSSMQAEIKARGGSLEDYAYLSPLTRNAAQTNENVAAVGELNRGALDRQSGIDRMMTGALQESASMLATRGASEARGRGQSAMDDLYSRWLDRQNEIDTAQAKTALEKEDNTQNTYLTLKERQQQAAAEAAALQLEYAHKGAQLSEQQRHNMSTEQAARDRIAMSDAQFQATYGLSKAKFDLELTKYENELATGGSTKTPKGFNAANKYIEQALGSSGLSKSQATAIMTGIKNKSPLMKNGQGYSRGSKGYYELLTGGGNPADLEAYIDRLVKYSGTPNNPANRSKIQSYLNQYALIAGKKA